MKKLLSFLMFDRRLKWAAIGVAVVVGVSILAHHCPAVADFLALDQARMADCLPDAFFGR